MCAALRVVLCSVLCAALCVELCAVLCAVLWIYLTDSVFDGVVLAGFKSRAIFFKSRLLAPFFFLYSFPFSSFFLSVGIVGLGVGTDRV